MVRMAKLDASLPPNENRGPKLLALYWTEVVLAVIIIVLRFYSRIRIKGLGWDDWIMLFTVVSSLLPHLNIQNPAADWYRKILGIALAGIATTLVSCGGTRHIYYLTASQMTRVLRLNWMLQPFGVMALATSKVSVAILMLRIMSSTMVWRRRFLYFSVISVLTVSVIVSILNFAQCNPPKALWTFVPGAKCWDPRVLPDIAVFVASKCSARGERWEFTHHPRL